MRDAATISIARVIWAIFFADLIRRRISRVLGIFLILNFEFSILNLGD